MDVKLIEEGLKKDKLYQEQSRLIKNLIKEITRTWPESLADYADKPISPRAMLEIYEKCGEGIHKAHFCESWADAIRERCPCCDKNRLIDKIGSILFNVRMTGRINASTLEAGLARKGISHAVFFAKYLSRKETKLLDAGQLTWSTFIENHPMALMPYIVKLTPSVQR